MAEKCDDWDHNNIKKQNTSERNKEKLRVSPCIYLPGGIRNSLQDYLVCAQTNNDLINYLLNDSQKLFPHIFNGPKQSVS